MRFAKERLDDLQLARIGAPSSVEKLYSRFIRHCHMLVPSRRSGIRAAVCHYDPGRSSGLQTWETWRVRRYTACDVPIAEIS